MSDHPFRPNVFLPYPTRPAFTDGLPHSSLVIKHPKLLPTPSLTSPQHKVLSNYPTLRPYPPYIPRTYTPQPPIPAPIDIHPTTPIDAHPPVTTPAFPSCDVTFITPEGQFQSTNYPENYGPNLSCKIRYS